MATFTYAARSRSGEKVEGTVEADDRRLALVELERMGHVPISVQESSGSSKSKEKTGKQGVHFSFHFRARRMSMADVLIFTTELNDLLSSGMQVGSALMTLSKRETGKAGDDIIASIRDEIMQGASLSDALAQHPRTFSKLYVSMICAGEAIGALPEIMIRLVEHYEKMVETREKVIAALVYPAIIAGCGVGTLAFVMGWLVPRFEEVFKSLGSTLPLPTQILFGLSKMTTRYGLFVAAALVVAIALACRAIKTERGRTWWHGAKLRMPLVRGIVEASAYSQFARTLSILLSNGVHVLEALGIVEKTISNVVISREIANARDRVTDGATISAPLAAGKVFPPMITDMMAVGEQTGDRAKSLDHIAKRYEMQLDRNVKILTSILEPIMIFVMAVLVGFVALSILLAVMDLTNGLQI